MDWNGSAFGMAQGNQGMNILGIPSSTMNSGFTQNPSPYSLNYFQNGGNPPPENNGSFFNSDAFKGVFGDKGLMGGLAMGAQAIGGIGSLIIGNQQLKLANKQFQLSKDAFYLNARNSIQSYNTAQQDRINGRYSDREKTQEEKDAMIKERSLKGI